MRPTDWDAVLDAVVPAVRDYLHTLPERRIQPDSDVAEILERLDVGLPDHSSPAAEVIGELADALEPYITVHASGRYFGFVIGGLHPASWGAELLASTWDQNAGLYAPTPGVTVAEQVAARWVVELARLPDDCSVGFVTGGQMATFTCLAAARDHVLREVGWDVEADGLMHAPRIHVIVKSGRHATVPRALRFLGLGERTALEVDCDGQDRMLPEALHSALEGIDGPTIVCLEAGNVNTGSFDRFVEVADLIDAHRARGHPTWVHVDGAVGLLARTSSAHDELTNGLERMDSWSTDAHKMLNVAYDCGIAICRHAAAHRAAMSVRASYLIQDQGEVREPMDFNPEFSRRARGLGVYATLRSLGREGVASIVASTSSMAARFADRLAATGRVRIVNDVVLNQVLVHWLAPDGADADAFNDDVVRRVQRDGTAFVSGTTWRGERMMRISVSNWTTDADDVDVTVDAMLRAADDALSAAAAG